MSDIHIHDAVPFEELDSADLVLDRIYRGGTAGSVADDPLNRLIPVGNSGGFRYKGGREAPLLIALYTTGTEDDWPDSLDPATSSIRNCIEQGIVPPAPVRLAGNVRAWPVAEANAIIAAAGAERILSKPRPARIGNQLLPARLGSPHRPADVGRWGSGSQVGYSGEL